MKFGKKMGNKKVERHCQGIQYNLTLLTLFTSTILSFLHSMGAKEPGVSLLMYYPGSGHPFSYTRQTKWIH